MNRQWCILNRSNGRLNEPANSIHMLQMLSTEHHKSSYRLINRVLKFGFLSMKRIISWASQDGESLSPVPERRQLQLIKALKAFNCLSLTVTSKLTNCPILTCRYILESLELALQGMAMGLPKGQELQVLIRPDCRDPEA